MRFVLLSATLFVLAGAASAQTPPPGGPPNWDTNGDGVVTRQEYDIANAERFTRLDANGDGALAGDEVRDRPPGPPPGGARPSDGASDRREPPPSPDVNNDGTVTRAEFVAAAERRFQELDRNHDGRLAEDELAPRRGPPPQRR